MNQTAVRAGRPRLAIVASSLFLASAPASGGVFRQFTENHLPDGVGLQYIGAWGSDLAIDGTTAWVTGPVTTLVHSTPFVLVNQDAFVGRVSLAGGGLVVKNAIEAHVNPDGTRFDDAGMDIVALSDGSAIVAGNTFTVSPDGSGVLVMRVDSGCTPVWTGVWGTARIEETYHLVETDDGGVIVLSRTDGFTPGFDFDLLLLKVSAGGALEWEKLYETSVEERAGGIVRTSDGNYVVAGSTGLISDNRTFLMKVDGTGTVLWATTYLATCHAETVIEAANGDLLVAGYRFASGTDGYVLRTASDGTPIWGRPVGRSGGSMPEVALSLVESGSGIVAGGQASLDPWLFRLNSTGTIVEFSVAVDNTDLETSAIRDVVGLPSGDLLVTGEWNGRRLLTLRADGANLACDELNIAENPAHFARTDIVGSAWTPAVSSVMLTEYLHTRIEVALTTPDSTVCSEGVTGAPEVAGGRERLTLHPASPNPFAGATLLSFTLDRPRAVSLDVYDVTGRRVRSLLEGRPFPAGSHDVGFDASGLAGGVYFCELVAGGTRERRKLTVHR